ncbi:MAG TPA: 4-hydroxy-3-methylbut-2-enyl diphosphate reductase [Solirubrobacteraceae bacterium]|nr:4-hydroxy-3-methylbut-2-enyl diphosphate reductase [Solirubrobacteraceae bacterium]
MSTAVAPVHSSDAPDGEDETPPGSILVLAPLALEARALRAGAPWADVRRVGMGPRRAARFAQQLARYDDRPVVIAGFGGALDPTLQPGDIVLASELRGPAGASPCADPTILAGVLRRGGMRVHVGPILSSERPVVGEQRRRLSQGDALAVDMESAWLVPAAHRAPLVTLRVVLDTSRRELRRPLHTLTGASTAYRALRRAGSLMQEWALALGTREVVLAAPRASCAGVERAVEIVERALEDRGAPIYVRKQIVHNAHVVRSLEDRGAIFVDELDEVPVGATVIFSAHGVSPAVREAARRRQLDVIDATCPLVAKVHAEARRFAASGFDIVLVGHDGHEEVEGTYGEAPQRTQIVATPEDVAGVRVADPRRVAYLTQTTLAVDETERVVSVLRERFPQAVGPASSDICYATQNRQDAVRALARDCDLILVVGSENSSNSKRLVEVAERAGCRARLIDDAADLPPSILRGTRRVGVTAGASAPESLVEQVLAAIGGLGETVVSERHVATETVQFKLPPEVRGRSASATSGSQTDSDQGGR